MGRLARHYIDSPAPGERIHRPQTPFIGWAAAHLDDPLRSVTLRLGTYTQPLDLVERADVAQTFPEFLTTGFQTSFALDAAGHENADDVPFELEFTFATGTERLLLTNTLGPAAAAAYAALKARKLAAIRTILQCPRCASGALRDADSALVCDGCATSYPHSKRAYDFLSDDLKALGAVAQTANVSANPYDDAAYAIIERHRDGLVLDAGSGLRGDYLPNVVNFEIVEYASTDVVGVCERLPFQSDAFDAVFSFSVLEHVRDPFQAARELVRVLKPGGILYAAVPFLQPFHGYPDHYYNMTSSGLRNLFRELIVETSDVPHYGLPIWALTWMLRSWVAALPPAVADDLLGRKVSELIGNPLDYLAEDFVTQLPARANEELACVNRLIARKPSRSDSP